MHNYIRDTLHWHFTVLGKQLLQKIVNFVHIDSKINPADMLSKHWGYQKVWPMLKPLLFYEGDTMGMLDETTIPTNGECDKVLLRSTGPHIRKSLCLLSCCRTLGIIY